MTKVKAHWDDILVKQSRSAMHLRVAEITGASLGDGTAGAINFTCAARESAPAPTVSTATG
jgi:hypothetical protein